MEFYLARAATVTTLNEYQLRRVHEREAKIGRTLAPFEVLSVVPGTIPPKHFWNVPSDPESQRAWNDSLRVQLVEHKLISYEGGGHLDSGNVEAVHSFDWMVWKNRGLLKLSVAPTGKVKRNPVLERLKRGGGGFGKNVPAQEEEEPPLL